MDNQPIQSIPPPLSSSNSPKTILLILGTIVLMAVSALGGYYLGSNKQSQPSQSVSTTINAPSPTIPQPTSIPDINNWKTYVSEDTTFSFKYPPALAVKTTKKTNYILGDESKAYDVTDLDIYPYYYLIYATNPDFKNLDIFDILKKNLTNLIGVTDLSIEITTLNSIALNNPSPDEVAVAVINYCYPEGCQKNTYFKKESTIFRTGRDNQILSTFQFLN